MPSQRDLFAALEADGAQILAKRRELIPMLATLLLEALPEPHVERAMEVEQREASDDEDHG